MKILLDAFGGDNSPLEMIKGAVEYVAQGGKAEIVLVGKEEVIEKIFNDNGYSKKNISIMNADDVITCEDVPTEAVRKKPNSSIVVGLNALRLGGYDAFLSAGSTGAVLTGAVLRVGRVNKLSRPALGTLLPTSKGNEVMLLDCGANADCKPINLVHFALMGNLYMKNVQKVEKPRVALLCNGTEDEKGSQLTHAVFPVLKSLSCIDFVGNIEGRDILTGDYDVIVTDGFSGNIALKGIEGAVGCIIGKLVEHIKADVMAGIGYKLFMKRAFKATMKELDYNKKGGAVLLGTKGVVVKIHGSSKASGVVAGLFQAERACEHNLTKDIEEVLATEEVASISFE